MVGTLKYDGTDGGCCLTHSLNLKSLVGALTQHGYVPLPVGILSRHNAEIV